VSTGLIIAIIAIVVVLLLVIFAVSIYNGLVKRRNAYKNSFAQIDVQLTRRHDLIPNLVETAKGYIKHERETLEAVIAARSGAVNAQQQARQNPGDPQAMQNLGEQENMLTQTLGRLFALQEAYPDLKANQNFQQLQEELTATEDKIAYARQFYNDSVMRYNAKIQSFPAVVYANMLGFKPREYFEVEGDSRGPVQVKF